MAKIINDAKTYVYRIRKCIWASLLLFIVAVGAGFWTTQHYPQEMGAYLEEVQAFFSSMQSPSPWGTFLLIFQNNTEAMLTVVLLGVFAGLFSLTFLLMNGFVVGVFLYLYYLQGMLPVFILGIVPHGIVEIPAMLISAAIGFRIGVAVIRKIFRQKESLTYELAEGIKFTVLFIIPALALAALIETYITPYFIALAEDGFRL